MIGVGIGVPFGLANLAGAVQALFAAGEQGAWYDPSDFSTLFQDSAGTTPVTATTQPVGKILDKSGRGNHATQATAINRPILQQDASGFYYLATNGTNSSMSTGSIDFTGTNAVTVWSGATRNSDAGSALVCELSASSNDPAGHPGAFGLAAPFGAGANYGFQSTGTATLAVQANTAAAPTSHVVTGQSNIATPSLSVRVDGVQGGASATTQGTGSYGNYPLYIGARAGTSLFFNGRIYSLIVRGAASNATQISNAERYVGSRMGISL